MDQPQNTASIERFTVVDVSDESLVFRRVHVPDTTPTGRQVLASLGLSPHNEYIVLQWLPGGDIEEVRPEEQVDMTGIAAPKLIVEKTDRTFRLVLNDHSIEWPANAISEHALRTLAAVDPAQHIYLQREDEADLLIEPGTDVNLKHAGVETFYTKADEWKLNVQGVTIKGDTPEISVRDALTKAGFDTDTAWIIVLKSASGRRQVDLNYIIDLREPGIEKLRLTPREINNGEVATARHRDFALLPTDEEWLTAHGHDWATIIDAGRRWLVLRDVELPAGYNVGTTTVAIEIPTAYPMAEIDMFYCNPALARTDGQPIPQTQVSETITGRVFQRWSRHRGAIAPWRPGKDSVVTHLLLVEESLAREVEK
ncbi:multiubiquitin domain-containing protein [Sphingomonas sp. TX0543]|uniref:multiubiquitin domain-containing protein n=1 Tax=unclassified Sphingomonas TaxID=196159 RepID=UPI0010F43AF7|nr:multiubiquitin domain-containing protein [Sphingomonas sp. 3P27F8]